MGINGWIGLMSQEGASGSFRWTETGDIPSFTRWYWNQPDDGQTSCVILSPWHDVSCNEQRPTRVSNRLGDLPRRRPRCPATESLCPFMSRASSGSP
eukprot:363897-Hanusia_phi.AAC.1